MELNEFGEIARQELEKIPQRFNNIKLHEYVIMPNHIHAIIEICRERS